MSMGLGGIFGDARMPWEKTMPGGFDTSQGHWGINTDMPEVAAPKAKRGGIFGSGINLGDILGMVGDGIAQYNGAEPVYGRSMLMARQRAMAAEQDARSRAAEREDWLWKQQHTAPKVNDTVADFEWFSKLTPEQKSEYARMKQGDPLVNMTLPNGQFYSGPQSGLGAALGRGTTAGPQEGQTATNPKTGAKVQFRGGQWLPMGGQSPASRPFADYPDPMKAPGRMTSGRRTVEGNRLVGGKPNSHHLRGDAADYVGATIPQLRAYFGPNARFLNEGDHIHTTLPGYGKVPYFGRRGTIGAK